MDSDDPFSASDDRTVIRPVPGGRRADIRRDQSHAQARVSGGPLLRLGGLNPLEKAASGLLALLTRLNNSRTHPAPEGLKKQIIHEMQVFQKEAQGQGIDSETVYSARYILCTVLDESVLNTPWGHTSGWAQKSLLSSFHKEVSGGERFFQLLKSLGQNPSKNLNLLELMYLCLALGFQGRYRIVQGGKEKLAQVKEWLYQIIMKERGAGERILSPHWEGVTDKRNPLMQFVPIWVMGAVAAGVLAALFAGLLMHLNRLSDPVFNQIVSIKAPEVKVVEPPPLPHEPDKPPPPAPPPIKVAPVQVVTLTLLLSEEISQGLVGVVEQPDISTVTIQGDGLFRSGRTTVKESIIPLLHRIGESLNQIPGHVLITGHSDSVPIRSTRYPSNWHLSQARADAVATIIRQDLDDQGRAVTEGKGEAEPVASNKTRDGRAKNRRVEILLIR